MKKTIVILLSLFMVLSFTACGNSDSQEEQVSNNENITKSASPTENINTDDVKDTDVFEAQKDRTIVVYFSATNTTEGVAKYIANGLNAELYEIVPETPYTNEDLNYNDNNSRTTVEMNNPDARPAILGSVENMKQYDIVFIGYPKMEYLNKSVYSV